MFDLGGVLIECSPFTKLLEWQSWTNDVQEIRQKWSKSKAFYNYQLGTIGTKEFVESIIGEFELSVSIVRFIRDFRLIPKGFFSGAEELLKHLNKKYTTVCFSNTNEVHWNKLCGVNKLDKKFKKSFASHIIHKAKPDEEAFRYVVDQLKVKPQEIVFFDDREENINAAREIGINAYLTNGFEEVKNRVKEIGL